MGVWSESKLIREKTHGGCSCMIGPRRSVQVSVHGSIMCDRTVNRNFEHTPPGWPRQIEHTSCSQSVEPVGMGCGHSDRPSLRLLHRESERLRPGRSAALSAQPEPGAQAPPLPQALLPPSPLAAEVCPLLLQPHRMAHISASGGSTRPVAH
eukprot:329836-Hanusia_phi.AAC.2